MITRYEDPIAKLRNLQAEYAKALSKTKDPLKALEHIYLLGVVDGEGRLVGLMQHLNRAEENYQAGRSGKPMPIHPNLEQANSITTETRT